MTLSNRAIRRTPLVPRDRAITIQEAQRLCRELHVTMVPKASSRLMRGWGSILRLFRQRDVFMRHVTTTLNRTIYLPKLARDPWSPPYLSVLHHELIHVDQARLHGFWWLAFSYAVLWFPIGLAWWRWRWEREAYLVNIQHYRYSTAYCVRVLSQHYGWCWPRRWMTRWFDRHANRRPKTA